MNLESRAEEMSWDWDAEDIDPDEDDGKVWVPVTPKTLGEGAHTASHGPRVDGQEPGAAGRVNPAGQMMRVYALSQDSMSEQAVAPVLCSVQSSDAPQGLSHDDTGE